IQNVISLSKAEQLEDVGLHLIHISAWKMSKIFNQLRENTGSFFDKWSNNVKSQGQYVTSAVLTNTLKVRSGDLKFLSTTAFPKSGD
ncbi:hypothetical protein L9F63_019857, partial [Diploptera punctata]